MACVWHPGNRPLLPACATNKGGWWWAHFPPTPCFIYEDSAKMDSGGCGGPWGCCPALHPQRGPRRQDESGRQEARLTPSASRCREEPQTVTVRGLLARSPSQRERAPGVSLCGSGPRGPITGPRTRPEHRLHEASGTRSRPLSRPERTVQPSELAQKAGQRRERAASPAVSGARCSTQTCQQACVQTERPRGGTCKVPGAEPAEGPRRPAVKGNLCSRNASPLPAPRQLRPGGS